MGGQREKALEVAEGAPSCSVGAAIAPLLRSATGMVGNTCAGNIGDFYQQQKNLLYSSATDDNIRMFAKRETEFFKTAGGCAGLIGGMVSASLRADLIRRSANDQRGSCSDSK